MSDCFEAKGEKGKRRDQERAPIPWSRESTDPSLGSYKGTTKLQLWDSCLISIIIRCVFDLGKTKHIGAPQEKDGKWPWNILLDFPMETTHVHACAHTHTHTNACTHRDLAELPWVISNNTIIPNRGEKNPQPLYIRLWGWILGYHLYTHKWAKNIL